MGVIISDLDKLKNNISPLQYSASQSPISNNTSANSTIYGEYGLYRHVIYSEYDGPVRKMYDEYDLVLDYDRKIHSALLSKILNSNREGIVPSLKIPVNHRYATIEDIVALFAWDYLYINKLTAINDKGENELILNEDGSYVLEDNMIYYCPTRIEIESGLSINVNGKKIVFDGKNLPKLKVNNDEIYNPIMLKNIKVYDDNMPVRLCDIYADPNYGSLKLPMSVIIYRSLYKFKTYGSSPFFDNNIVVNTMQWETLCFSKVEKELEETYIYTPVDTYSYKHEHEISSQGNANFYYYDTNTSLTNDLKCIQTKDYIIYKNITNDFSFSIQWQIYKLLAESARTIIKLSMLQFKIYEIPKFKFSDEHKLKPGVSLGDFDENTYDKTELKQLTSDIIIKTSGIYSGGKLITYKDIKSINVHNENSFLLFEADKYLSIDLFLVYLEFSTPYTIIWSYYKHNEEKKSINTLNDQNNKKLTHIRDDSQAYTIEANNVGNINGKFTQENIQCIYIYVTPYIATNMHINFNAILELLDLLSKFNINIKEEKYEIKPAIGGTAQTNTSHFGTISDTKYTSTFDELEYESTNGTKMILTYDVTLNYSTKETTPRPTTTTTISPPTTTTTKKPTTTTTSTTKSPKPLSTDVYITVSLKLDQEYNAENYDEVAIYSIYVSMSSNGIEDDVMQTVITLTIQQYDGETTNETHRLDGTGFDNVRLSTYEYKKNATIYGGTASGFKSAAAKVEVYYKKIKYTNGETTTDGLYTFKITTEMGGTSL